jgi:hypothetical protein
LIGKEATAEKAVLSRAPALQLRPAGDEWVTGVRPRAPGSVKYVRTAACEFIEIRVFLISVPFVPGGGEK